MFLRPLIIICALGALSTLARADGATSTPAPPPLPTLAIDPEAPPPSIWKGLYVGSEVTFATAKHARGLWGGGAYIGYDHHFDNNLVLGVRASAGFEPFPIANSRFKGWDYAETTAKVGYEMGRLTPYLTAGIALAKPNGFPAVGFVNPTDSINNVFNGGAVATSGVFGAGFDYALTSNTTIGIAAVVGTGRGFVAPP